MDYKNTIQRKLANPQTKPQLRNLQFRKQKTKTTSRIFSQANLANVIWSAVSHRAHDTESISSLADLYNSSLLAHFCLLSINAGSSASKCASCLACRGQRTGINQRNTYFVNLLLFSFLIQVNGRQKKN